MHIRAPALILAVRAHGEHGAVVRGLTEGEGLQPGYVRGGRSTRLRPILQPGNLVIAEYRARSETQLAALTVELVQSRAGLFAEPLASAALEWVCGLTAAALPEAQGYPQLYAALAGTLDAIEAGASARQWVAALVRYELLVVRELGYGLQVPEFLREARVADWPELIEALRANGRAIEGHILTDRRAGVLDARGRLIERLKRAVG